MSSTHNYFSKRYSCTLYVPHRTGVCLNIIQSLFLDYNTWDIGKETNVKLRLKVAYYHQLLIKNVFDWKKSLFNFNTCIDRYRYSIILNLKLLSWYSINAQWFVELDHAYLALWILCNSRKNIYLVHLKSPNYTIVPRIWWWVKICYLLWFKTKCFYNYNNNIVLLLAGCKITWKSFNWPINFLINMPIVVYLGVPLLLFYPKKGKTWCTYLPPIPTYIVVIHHSFIVLYTYPLCIHMHHL